jgi:hypothetical protein
LANPFPFLRPPPSLARRPNGSPSIFCLTYFIRLICTGHIIEEPGRFLFVLLRTFAHFSARRPILAAAER